MSLRLIVTLFLLNSIVLFSQENITKHTIVKGETISSIAEKYDVKQSAIFKLNPKAKNILKLNSILLITVAASIVCFRGTFPNPIHKKFVFFKFHPYGTSCFHWLY